MSLTLYFIIKSLAYIVKHLGQAKERKTVLTMVFGIVVTKSLKALRMTRLRKLGCCWSCLSRGEGGIKEPAHIIFFIIIDLDE